MPQNPLEVTNPGIIDIADQGDGLTVVDQPVTVGTAQTAGRTVQGAAYSPLRTGTIDQPVTTGPSQSSGRTVAGGTYSPQSSRTEDVSQDQVATQVLTSPYPANVFV